MLKPFITQFNEFQSNTKYLKLLKNMNVTFYIDYILDLYPSI